MVFFMVLPPTPRNFSITPCRQHFLLDSPQPGLAMASTLRAYGPPPAIRALVDSGSHMCDPYGAGALVSASHHANTERLRTGLLRSYLYFMCCISYGSDHSSREHGGV